MKKVSVIIPMYNSEKYIRQCLESVQRQNCQDLEILVIDDGSADSGGVVCEEMGQADSRIRLYRQENKGVSAARNAGIETAEGEYVFFLDSDDVIHPSLIAVMLGLAEDQQADLVFCDYRKLKAERIDTERKEAVERESRVRWQAAAGEEAENWFHIRYFNELAGIGGKLVRRAAIGSLRFDTNLTNGEDTWFLYHLIRKRIRMVYLRKDWYSYRIHPESVTQSSAMVKGKRYYESCRRIREEEYQRGNIGYALTWERLTVAQMEKKYKILKHIGDHAGCKSLRKIAAEEKRHPMFSHLVLRGKLWFYLCFRCYPAYVLVAWLVQEFFKWEEAIKMTKKHADIGIITFHCSNNYGAMLQAYGLKSFLRRNGKDAEIVRYEPPYMTGRHWWIPYAPIRGLKGRIWGVFNLWNGFIARLRTREDYARQLANMNYFRYRYLVDKRRRKILFSVGLRKLKYRYYVVGSDQIWNPDLTCGLKKAYLGAFQNGWKEKVIAYAGSIGGTELPESYDKEFSKLISHIDAVSVREEAAVPYVERLYGREVMAVLDPVFFLKKESWKKVERIPEKARNRKYILVYVTESNQEMSEYVKKLSEDTGLSVIEVRAGQLGLDMGFEVDHTTGPAELLGYIHNAEYVVSNSFHAVAFSIIYEKRFLAFAHRSLGARMRNIIQIHGLQDRLCEEGEVSDINVVTDWQAVRERTKANVKASGEFLLNNLRK